MKKFFCVLAVVALCTPVFADELQLRVVGAGDASAVSATEGEAVEVTIQGMLTAGDTDGLALWGVNIKASGTTAFDLCDQGEFLLEAPVSMESFDRNLGLTNPPGPPDPVTGYSGTCDGAGGLWQLGGGQNTIGNTGPTVYPIGDVVPGVANGVWADLATGTLTFPVGGTEIILTLDTGFANTLDPAGGRSAEVFAVSAATVSIAGSLTISGGCPPCPGGTTSACPEADVNCDDIADGFDIAVIRQGTNWLMATEDAGNCRADVNGDGLVDGFDIARVRQGSCWLQ